ncbi:MAG: hypothetical protein ACYTKD_15865 [Planctomycetota bacterium]|jgi:hypothetical protein
MRVKMSKRPWTEREVAEFRLGMADYLRRNYARALREDADLLDLPQGLEMVQARLFASEAGAAMECRTRAAA